MVPLGAGALLVGPLLGTTEVGQHVAFRVSIVLGGGVTLFVLAVGFMALLSLHAQLGPYGRRPS